MDKLNIVLSPEEMTEGAAILVQHATMKIFHAIVNEESMKLAINIILFEMLHKYQKMVNNNIVVVKETK